MCHEKKAIWEDRVSCACQGECLFGAQTGTGIIKSWFILLECDKKDEVACDRRMGVNGVCCMCGLTGRRFCSLACLPVRVYMQLTWEREGTTRAGRRTSRTEEGSTRTEAGTRTHDFNVVGSHSTPHDTCKGRGPSIYHPRHYRVPRLFTFRPTQVWLQISVIDDDGVARMRVCCMFAARSARLAV